MNRYVPSVSRCLIPAFVTACLATGALAQQGPPGGLGVTVLNNPLPVFVANPPNQSTNSFIVNPGDIGTAVGKSLGVGTPVTLNWDFDSRKPFGTGFSYTVPAGQTLVIEAATGFCRFSNYGIDGLFIGVQQTVQNPTAIPSLWLISIPFVLNSLSSSVFNISSKARVAAGTTITMVPFGTDHSGPDAFMICQTTTYGQLITP